MSALRLSDRSLGSEFCRFERSLIFNEELKDTGFVRYLSPGTFTLMGSKFTEIDNGRVYMIPEDLKGTIDEGSFINVVPGHVEKAVIPLGKGRGALADASYREVAEVLEISEARVPLPPPILPVDEFLYRVSENWRSANEDLLDMVIALLLVSAPSSVYGEGGIGSEGLEVMRAPGTGTPLDVSATVLSHLPMEFRMKGSSAYRYSTFETSGEYLDFKKDHAPENTYSVIRRVKYLKSLRKFRIPVHLPFLLQESEMKAKRTGIDIDVLDYQLTALYTPSPSEGVVVRFADELARDAHGGSIWDGYGAASIDPLSALRIGLGLTRIHIGKQFDGKGFSRKVTDLSEGRKLFQELLSRGSQEVERRMKREKTRRPDEVQPWRDRLKPLDREVFFELRARAEETGILEFPAGDLPIKLDRKSLDDSLERLNRYGYILYMKGGTMIRLVLDSSPEDLS